MSSAAFQYQKSLGEARYKQLAQKLDHLLSNLADDPNTKVRWVWQLIQNAKDVPNQFGKVKIKIVVNDNSMTFSHNGDPFRPSDLESVVGQYSKKVEENSEETQTTGKYGTGFVTTYILSRKILVKGLLMIIQKNQETPEQKSTDEKEKTEKQFDDQVEMVKVQMTQNSAKIEESADEREQKLNLNTLQTEQTSLMVSDIDKVKQNSDEEKMEERGTPFTPGNMKYENRYYQHFQIPLDRQYKNREKQLVPKLRKNQLQILNILDSLQELDYWQRTVDDFDTSFTYQNLDKASFKMIADGIGSLQEMFLMRFYSTKNFLKFQCKTKERNLSSKTSKLLNKKNKRWDKQKFPFARYTRKNPN